MQNERSRFHAGLRARNSTFDQLPEPSPTLDFSKICRSIVNLYFGIFDASLCSVSILLALEVVKEDGRPVLSFTAQATERALIYDSAEFRDGHIVAQVKPLDAEAKPHVDRNDCHEALVCIVFRVQTSRTYYQFGIEGKRRAVLYRRIDDEWFILAEQIVELTDDYLTLKVALDGDGIRCHCAELGVDFFCTDTTSKHGKAGIRSLGRARLVSLKISQTHSQTARDERRRKRLQAEERELGESVPEPTLVKTFDFNELGGTPIFLNLDGKMYVFGPENQSL